MHNWLDSSDDALDGVGQVLHRAKELVTNAANTGTMTPEDREKIKIELEQLQEQIQDLANTKVGDKYIFSGTNTDKPSMIMKHTRLMHDASIETSDFMRKSVEIEVFDGVILKVNTNAADMFKDINDCI